MIDDADGTAQRYARLQLLLSIVSVTVTVVYLIAVILAEAESRWPAASAARRGCRWRSSRRR